MSATAQTLRPPSKTLMFLEGRAIHEFGAFLGALPLLSLAPRGDGHPVLVFPGLVASDTSTRPLRSFLQEQGLRRQRLAAGPQPRPAPWRAGGMVDLVRELSDVHRRKISLVGWSLGGLYARQLAKMMPDRVRSVITLGSPFAGHPKATNAWRVYEMASGRRADEEDHRFGGSLSETPPVPTTAIFSRTDGICAWQGCMEKPSATGRKHRGRKQPLRHGPSSRRRLCGGRSPRPGRRAMEAVRPLAAGAASSIPIRTDKSERACR